MLKGLFYIFLGIMLACSCDSKSKKQNEQEANTPTNVNDSNAIAKNHSTLATCKKEKSSRTRSISKTRAPKALSFTTWKPVAVAPPPSMTKNRFLPEEKEKSKLNLTLRADMVNNTK